MQNRATTSFLSRKVLRCATACLAYLAVSASNLTVAAGLERQSAPDLHIHSEDNAAVLAWPSNPRECFAILWRSNTADQTPWIVLTNLLHASSQTKITTFRDLRRFEPTPTILESTNAVALYQVLVIPDFWFDLKTVELNGGPKNPGQDFLPIYYGNKETGIQKPSVELLVDGMSAGIGGTVDETIQRVNFGTQTNPQWIHVAGFWFDHKSLTNGEHTLQLLTSIRLNRFVGDLSQSVTLTNEPICARTSQKNRARDSWWCQRLGCEFVRKRPTLEDSRRNFITGGENPMGSKIPDRPIKLLPTQTMR